MEFELAYYDSAVQRFKHYTTMIPLSSSSTFPITVTPWEFFIRALADSLSLESEWS